MDRILVFGLLLITFSASMVGAGSVVPILGLLLTAIAPNTFLVGLAMVVFSIARKRMKYIEAAKFSPILLTVLLGLNTRLPSVILDALDWNKLQILRPWSGAVGQAIHIETNTPELSGRRFPYESVAPACHGEGCFTTSGFRGPHTSAYWREDVVDTALAAGFSKASANEKTPRLVVSESKSGNLAALTFELKDEGDVLLARFQGVFRNGYPLETKDSGGSERVSTPWGLLQYLMHGNSISYWLSRLTRPNVEPPLEMFLKMAALLSHPQEHKPGNATPLTLEILSVKHYEPVWIIKNHDDGVTRWADLAFDKPRDDRCAQLLKPEKAGAHMAQGWLLFNADPTRRKKVRYTGTILCEAEVLWFFDYSAEHGKTILTKYTVAGDLVYRISFDEPESIYGFSGHIMSPTFKEEAGFINFEWWNSTQSGYDRHIKRSMRVRLAVPEAPSP
ncbi:MAG: hypothetical protein HY253_05655 [Burkholderiales bacterium]|nr:hypothetical protein [Burkholderiales bacterium]